MADVQLSTIKPRTKESGKQHVVQDKETEPSQEASGKSRRTASQDHLCSSENPNSILYTFWLSVIELSGYHLTPSKAACCSLCKHHPESPLVSQYGASLYTAASLEIPLGPWHPSGCGMSLTARCTAPISGRNAAAQGTPHAQERRHRHCESSGFLYPSVFLPSHREQMGAYSLLFYLIFGDFWQLSYFL